MLMLFVVKMICHFAFQHGFKDRFKNLLSNLLDWGIRCMFVIAIVTFLAYI